MQTKLVLKFQSIRYCCSNVLRGKFSAIVAKIVEITFTCTFTHFNLLMAITINQMYSNKVMADY